MKRILRRVAGISTAAVIAVGAGALLAGCSSNNPEVTITYEFNGQTYEVEYKLSRLDAPKTVTHFIELADADFYNDTCVHDYDGVFFQMGGYRIEEGELSAIDYFTEVKELESKKEITFTQSVWKRGNTDSPLYTVYGEFDKNGNYPAKSREFSHGKGALVMTYTDKGNFKQTVTTLRNDGGKGNNNDKYDNDKDYMYNSATSLFYTYTGETSTSRAQDHSVFGMAIDYEGQFQPLVDAINEYVSDRTDDEGESDYSFTTERTIQRINENEQGDDPDFEELRRGDVEATYKVPLETPIYIRSVKVTKY